MRRPDPVEVVAIAIPLIAEAIAVCLFIAACAVWLMVLQ
jgi:hypothetical protein